MRTMLLLTVITALLATAGCGQAAAPPANVEPPAPKATTVFPPGMEWDFLTVTISLDSRTWVLKPSHIGAICGEQTSDGYVLTVITDLKVADQALVLRLPWPDGSTAKVRALADEILLD